ncbi:MAG TPA: class I SAM-dependent methyltransferase, partial [Candidatus Limnocylindrales bacterium]
MTPDDGAANTPADARAEDGDPKAVVAAGYDRIAAQYLAWSGLRPSETRLRALSAAVDRIPSGGDILELGCGAGLPMTAALAEHGRVTGVDISAAQVELARANVPAATFIHADMTTLEFPAASFDAVVAFYALTHIPRDEQAPLLGRIGTWLRPGGVFVASMGVEDDPGGIERDWLGVDMYFSHFGARRNRRLVEAAGMQIESAEILPEPGDRHGARFLWVVARAPAGDAG